MEKILVVDDEQGLREVLSIMLKRAGYAVTSVSDGEEAIEQLQKEIFDLVITDLRMPKVDGIEVCRQLKKNALTRKIPVIMLTAKREMADKVVGVRVGADDYLTKPFEPRELRVRVKTFLEKGKRERNPITNLPTFSHVLDKLKNLDKGMDVYYLFLKNLDLYKKNYGFSKLNEMIRLTSQIITHNFERFGTKNFVGHDEDNNFILVLESKNAKNILKEVHDEFESTVPFFYDIDYENVDLNNNVIVKVDKRGFMEKIPLVDLKIIQVKKEEVKTENLILIRGG